MTTLLKETQNHALKCVMNVFWNEFESCKRLVALGNGLDLEQKKSLMSGIVSIVELGHNSFLDNLSKTDIKILRNWSILA